jgi:hypothetical protein
MTTGNHKEIDYDDRDNPAGCQIQKHQRQTEYECRFVENMHERKRHHDNAENKKYYPGFTHLQPMNNY